MLWVLSTRIIIQLGLRAPVTVRVLQLEVGTAPLLPPSQTKFSGHLLFTSLLPPLAAFPDSKACKEKDENKASEKDVRPPTQNLGLEFFFLLVIGDRGFLALIGRK